VWQQFRVRYPTGSLTAELITIHDGLFVVRAIVQVDDKMVATGLAAAMTVEEAEDHAKTRALAMLNVSPSDHLPSRVPLSRPVASEAPMKVLPHPSIRPMDLPVPSSISKSEPDSGWLAEEEHQLSIPEPMPDIPTAISAPTDDSDLMMKTSVEIRRLRWSNEQGRLYLENTYGKRSRQHLTREELLDFLQYLETQLTP
jgi:hypothetical protein